MKPKLAFLILLAAAACSANTIVIVDATGLPPADENGSHGSSGATYNGFVTATINGNPNQLILCDDFTHTTYVPSGNMVYDFSTVGGSNPLQNVRFTSGSMTQNYEEAAVLTWELNEYVAETGSKASNDTITDYQYALWNIFDPSLQVTGGQQTLQTAALNLMATESVMLTVDVYPYVEVYTPDPNGGSATNQEFLQYGAPEPGTLMLLAGALLLAAAWTVRLRRAA